MNAITTTLSFQGKSLRPAVRDGQAWLRLTEIEEALGYEARGTALARIYARHADEFTPAMTRIIKVATAGGKQAVRFFSLRGAHLLAMFARTEKAKAFRIWVLDILDREVADLREKASSGNYVDNDTRMNLGAVCAHMEYLCSWWKRYGEAIRGINRNAAGAIHDNFIDGVCTSRSIVRELGLKSARHQAVDFPWDKGPMERFLYSQNASRSIK